MQSVPLSTYTKPITCTYLAPVHIAGPSTTRVLSIMRILDTYKYIATLTAQVTHISKW